MKTFIKTILFVAFAVLASCQFAHAQTEPPKVCISQNAANIARDNALELEATKNKILVLEQALKDKDKTIAEIQETGRKNEADLKDVLSKTENALSTATGQLIQSQAEIVRQTAIITTMIPMLRAKRIALVNLF